MSYNIDNCEYLGGKRLVCTRPGRAALLDWSSDKELPDQCFVARIARMAEEEWDNPTEYVVVWNPYWIGEWSGMTWDLYIEALSFLQGTADILVTWEGGDSFSGLRVSEGKVVEHKVLHILGEPK